MLAHLLIWLFALVKLGHVYFFVFKPDAFTQRVLGVRIDARDGKAEYQTFQTGTYLSEVLFVLWAAYIHGAIRVAVAFIAIYLGLIVFFRIVFLLRHGTFGPMHRGALLLETPGLAAALYCLAT